MRRDLSEQQKCEQSFICRACCCCKCWAGPAIPKLIIFEVRAATAPGSLQMRWHVFITSVLCWGLKNFNFPACPANSCAAAALAVAAFLQLERTQTRVTELEAQPPKLMLQCLQDDMQLSVDFFPFFTAGAALLDADPTLYCVSSWNDNGQVRLEA